MIAPTPEHKVLTLESHELPCRMAVQHICRSSAPENHQWVEFLVRPEQPWHEMTPIEFVELGYRQRGLLFDQDVLRQSLDVADALPGSTWISVNIHPGSLHRERFVEFVRRQLERSGIAPTRLILELVEFGGPVNLMASRTVLEQLRGDGVRFALDDFGPGFSNLDLLGSNLIDFVKLDRSLVRFVDSESGYTRLVQGLQAMADHVDVALVAEGVETESQFRLLSRMGVGWIQGFYLSRPEFIATRNSNGD